MEHKVLQNVSPSHCKYDYRNIPLDEKEKNRLNEINEYNLSNFNRNDRSLQSITDLAVAIGETKLCFVTIVERKFINFLCRTNSEWTGTERKTNSFCHMAIQNDFFFEVPNTLEDERFSENCFTKGPDPLMYYGGFPLKSPNGYIIGCLVLCDYQPRKMKPEQIKALETLSEQVVINLELRKKNFKLQQALERALAKDDYVCNMSHEIRTPLNLINGFADILEKSNLENTDRQAVDVIKTSSKFLLNLMNDILEMSKLQSGKLILNNLPFDLGLSLNYIKEITASKAMEKENEVKFCIDERIPKRIKGDRVRLNQILLSLIGNSIKFTEKGQIQINVDLIESDDDYLKFTIKDSGLGLSEEKLKFINDDLNFDISPKDIFARHERNGLGLKISKNLVELMGGKLRAESEEGKGSEFSFTIKFEKLTSDEEKIYDMNFSDKDIESFKNLKILFVEDNALNNILIKNIFKKREAQIEIVENGKLACELLSQKNSFNVIFMDINMPVMNGIQATLYIRKCLKLTIPIIGFTANNSAQEKEYCLQNGMNDYITKILVFNDFFKILHRVLNDVKNNEKMDKINFHEIKKNLAPEEIQHNGLFEADYSNPLSENEDSTCENSSNSNGDNFSEYYSEMRKEIRDFAFNPEKLDEFLEGDENMKKEFLSIFVKETSEELTILEQAFIERNEGNLKFYIHKMKTPLLMLGFENVLEELLKIREMSKKTETSIDKVLNAFSSLKYSFGRTLNHITEFIGGL
jgi:signal transduction histidine kinase/DNA-binding NarL/FixJ family response regulator